MEICDIPVIATGYRRSGALPGCDNTWATGLLCEPLSPAWISRPRCLRNMQAVAPIYFPVRSFLMILICMRVLG
ncbi:hypothetical protein [Bradyrhizobium sp. STM 3566]|uniref:hypothetical protein n=1 Tax=Bradyrhizobium sp. STM 3566 TaxID=578928 RepID=UPI00388DB698